MSIAPSGPLDLADVIERYPTLRQSLLSSFDDCALSSLFKMQYEQGWGTAPQARGTIIHRVFAECLREMKRNDSETIPVGVAEAILLEALRQRDVEPAEIVRVPFREIPDMLMEVRKFAGDNSFTIRNLIDVERRLEAPITYRLDDGTVVERRITGQLDALIARPPDEAIVLDYKSTWALPPRHDEDADEPGLSFTGFFQQKVYAFLVMMTYPSINAVSLREFYTRRTEPRPARVVRSDLPKITEWLSIIVEQVDRALMAGPPPSLRIEDLETHGHWKPSPGKQCFWCAKARHCPLDDDYKDGGIRTAAEAEAAAAARQVAKAVDQRLTGWLKVWVDQNGAVPVKRAKGRLVLGYRKIKGGYRFSEYTPEGADRPSTEDATVFTDAMREASERSRGGKERVA